MPKIIMVKTGKPVTVTAALAKALVSMNKAVLPEPEVSETDSTEEAPAPPAVKDYAEEIAKMQRRAYKRKDMVAE
jgi:hypothetical protein